MPDNRKEELRIVSVIRCLNYELENVQKQFIIQWTI